MPVASGDLLELNAKEEGLDQAQYGFDAYNIAMWGSMKGGKFVSAYLGQLQTTYDLRSAYPIPNRMVKPLSDYDWYDIDADEHKWRAWVDLYKLYYLGAGWINDDDGHLACRVMAYEPEASPCMAQHTYYHAPWAEGSSPYDYKLMDGIGIKAVMEMGGNFIERLSKHGLDVGLDSLYVLHGSNPGAPGSIFEYDGMECPTCDPKGDGVLFEKSIAARDQLTQGWSADQKASKSKQEGVLYGHLEVGVTPAVWEKMIGHFKSLP
jgi:hypothetical protein